MRRLAGCFVLAVCCNGQSLEVLSEFQRMDPRGQVVAADRGAKPREILSPAAARNAYASFRVVARIPAGREFTLHIGQNPENLLRVAVYKEAFWVKGTESIPDALREVKLPYTEKPMEKDAVHTFWLDVWVPYDAPVRRIRVEAQLHMGGGWIIYPLEMRVIATIVPVAQTAVGGGLPPVTAGADVSALGPFRHYFCGEQPSGQPAAGPPTVRALIRRNAKQDISLARALEAQHGKEVVEKRLIEALGAASREQWCTAPFTRPAPGAEWYLKIRDALYRGPF